VIRVLRRNRSAMTGHVVWSGVSDIGPSRATVIAATSGTVSNLRTNGAEQPRQFRFRVALVHEGGRWLISDIAFVGGRR
jgi:Mce-associated membrane protein